MMNNIQRSQLLSRPLTTLRHGLLACGLLVLAWALVAQEPPSLVSSFYGTVTIDGAEVDQTVPVGTEIAASIGGTEFVTSTLFEGPDGISYALDVPGDLLNTAAVEGGQEGQSIVFRIGAGDAQETATWTYGGHSRLDLTAMAGPDINVSLDDGESLVTASQTLTYTLTVNNPDTDPASGIELAQTLPFGATLLNASDGGSASGDTVSWPLFDLAAGASTSRTAQVQLPATFAADVDFVESTALVTYEASQGIDPASLDNTSRDATLLDADPDLNLTIDDGVSSVNPGASLTYTLTVGNAGDQDAAGVVLQAPLSADSTFFTASDNGIESPPGIITWPAFDLPVGGTVTRTLTLRFDGGSGAGTFEQTATVQPGDTSDGNPADNSATDSNNVEQGVDLLPVLVDVGGAVTDLQSLQISGTASVHVLNDDNGPLATAFDITLFEDLDFDGQFTPGVDNPVGQQTFASGLAAGATSIFDLSLTGSVAFRDSRLWAFVDSADTIEERDEDNNLAHSAESCEATPVPEAFQPVIEMSWPQDDNRLVFPNSEGTVSTPIVAQLNDDNGDGTIDTDDRADIVFVTDDRDGGFFPLLRAIDGRNGNSRFETAPPLSQGVNFAPSGLAVGDLDDNGKPEIIVSGLVMGGGLPNVLLSYSNNGNLRWISDGYRTHPGTSVTNRDHPTLADLDGDGKSEILVGANVFDRFGNLLWSGSGGQGFQSASNNNNLDSGAISIAADLDMDGLQEVVTGNTAYRHDGTIYWQVNEDDGYPAVGNFDADDFPEIVVVARGFVRLHEHDGTLIWGPVELPGTGSEAGGAPTVADFDADGEPEIGVAGSTQYAVFETDGSVKWQRTIQDGSSNMTGSTVFDLDGDGRYEVIYRDETRLRIYRGEDGTVLFSDLVSSNTFNEAPVVADVDGDGRAEIIVSSDRALPNLSVPLRTWGIRVYGDLNDNWIGARAMWNQHAYHIDNVAADGSIPAQPAFSWLTHNTYRANLAPDGVQALAAADMTISRLTADLSGYPTVALGVRVGNGGLSLLPQNTPVALYDGDPDQGAALLGVVSTPANLAPGDYVDLQLDVTSPAVGSYTVFAVGGDDGQGGGARRECLIGNNRHSFTYDTSDLGLWLRADDGTDAVQPGAQLTYTFTLANGGSFPRNGVVLQDDLPLFTTLVSAGDGAQVSGDAGNGFTVTWPAVSLGAYETVQRTLTLQVNADIPLSSPTVTNTATATDDGTHPDPTPLNNTVVDINQVLTVLADIGGPYVGDEGATISFDGSASTDRDGTVVTWEWDLDDDGAFDDASGVTASRSFPDEGTYTVHLRVTDDSGEQDTASAQVTVNNVAASISLTATQTYNEGDAALLAATYTDGGSGDTHTATIDWGDGSPIEAGTVDAAAGTVNGGHGYPDNGVYTVELCLTDNDGATACVQQVITVQNVDPTVVTGGAVDLSTWTVENLDEGVWTVSDDGTSVTQSVNSQPTAFYGPFTAIGTRLEGQIEVLNNSGDDDFIGFLLGFQPGDYSNPSADYLMVDWKEGDQSLGSGAQGLEGLAVSRVRGIPTQDEAWSHSDWPQNGADQYIEELQRGLNLGNVGWQEETIYVFSFEITNASLRVWVNGSLEIDLLGDFNFGSGRFAFYNFSQPKVRYSGFSDLGQAIGEGDTAGFTLPFGDVGVEDTHSATIDWQDGTVDPAHLVQEAGGGTVSGSHTYLDDGDFQVAACVVDDDGGEGCGDVPIRVLNRAPDLTLESPAQAYLDRPYPLAASFTDLGVLDTHTATVDWGDGSPIEAATVNETGGSGTIAANHQYTAAGVYPLTLCVVDDDGGEACVTQDTSTLSPNLDVAVEVLASSFAVRPGEPLDFTVRVLNQGTLPASGVQVTLDVPAQLQPNGASLGGLINGQQITWTLPSLPYQGREYMQVQTTAASSLTFGQQVSAVATAADDGSEGPDSNPTDNTDTAGVTLWDALTPIVEVGINLSRGDTVTLNPSSQNILWPASHAVDGDAFSDWYTVCGDSVNQGGTPFFEIVLPQEASVWGLRYQGQRDGVGGDFLSGSFRLWDEADRLLYDSGDVALPAPDRDLILDLPNVLGAKRLRFTPSADNSCNPGFSELALLGVYGDAQEAHVAEGEDIHLGGLFHDVGDHGPYTSSIDWGDGTAATPTPESMGPLGVVTTSHAYDDNGVYPLEICITNTNGLLGCSQLNAVVSNAAPDVNDDPQVDLRLWQTESFAADSGDSSPNWVVAQDGRSVHQKNNSQASIFYGDFTAINTRLTGTIRTDNNLDNPGFSDDDFVGFAIGFQPEDTTNDLADFLIIDWKKSNQTLSGCGISINSKRGLVVSRVTGVPAGSEFWLKEDIPGCNSPGSVEVLQRGLNRGNSGWADRQTYTFTFEYTETQLRVFVDGVLEIDISGDFNEGRFAFYNHSQADVHYSAFDVEALVVDEGSPAPLVATFTDEGAADTHTATIDWGDGAVTPGTVVPGGTQDEVLGTHIYPDNLPGEVEYGAEVCVTDDDGATDCGTFLIQVLNVDPSVDAGADRSAAAGVDIPFQASYVDAGVQDTHTAEVDWGDGTVETLTVQVDAPGQGQVFGQHAFQALGTYTVEICVIDDDSGRGCDRLEVVVDQGRPPVDLVATLPPSLEAEPADLTFSFNEPDGGETHTVSINWGDGSGLETLDATAQTGGGSATARHYYADNGNYTVDVCVTDSSGLQTCTATMAQIGNAAPRLGRMDFTTWQQEDLAGNLAVAQWQITPDGSRVQQDLNNDRSFFYSDDQALGGRWRGRVRPYGDDDYWGFVLGFQPGDMTAPDSDYLYVFWKGGVQGSSPVGLRVVRVRGDVREELATALTLGDAPWVIRDYMVELELQPNHFRLWIDGVLELDHVSTEPFSPGRFGFYSGAQEGVQFADWHRAVPEAVSTGTDVPFRQTLDLNTFSPYYLPHNPDAALCNWAVQPSGLRVDQNLNCRAGVFASDRDLAYGETTAIMRFTGDNDIGGLAFGFQAPDGDTFDDDFLLASWRRQAANDGNSPTGLRLHRMRGPDYVVNDTNPGAELLANAATQGTSAWVTNRNYYLRARVEPLRFRLWVNGVLEFDVTTTADNPFPEGRFGIYQNFQEGLRVRYVEHWALPSAFEGDAAPNVAFAFADPGTLDTHTAAMDWQDGGGSQAVTLGQGVGLGNGVLPPHTFQDDNLADGQLCVTDDDGDTTCERVPVWVRNLPPVTDAGQDGFGYIDVPIALDGSLFTDPGVLDTHSATVDWGDGTVVSGIVTASGNVIASGGTVDATHTYSVDGTYTALVCVTDDDGGIGCDSATFTIVPGDPILEVRKVDSMHLDVDGDGRVDGGDQLRYDLEVVNVGEGPANDVLLTDAIPLHTDLLLGNEVASQGSVAVAADNRSFEVAMGQIQPQQTVTVSFLVQLVDPLPLRTFEVSNQAVVSSRELDDVLSDDPDTPEAADPTRTPLAQAGDTQFCTDDGFDVDGPVSADWTLANLGDADEGQVEILGSALRLSGDGSSLYHGNDDGTFLYRTLEGDARVEVDFAGVAADLGGTYRKACLMLRSSLATDAARVMVCYVPGDPRGPALYFDARPNDGDTPTELASTQVGVALPLRVALVRRGDVITASYLTTSGVWQEPLGALGNDVTLGLGTDALVGLTVTGYDPAPVFSVDFDNWRQCRPNDELPPGEGTPPSCGDEPLDVVYLVDFSQSMDADFPGAEPGTDASKLGAAKVALDRLHQQVLARGDGSRASLVTFYGASDVDTNLAGAAQVRVPLTTDLGSVADALFDLDGDDRPGFTTTPTALAIEEVEEVIAASHDSNHRLAVVLVTDGIPNVDFAGRGHHQYLLGEMQAIELRDVGGDFLPWTQVAWQGRYNAAYGTFDGEPLANAMFTLDHLAGRFPDLMVYGIGIQGDGVDLGTFQLDLVDYAAYVSGGLSFGPSTHDGLRHAVDTLLLDLFCGADGTSLAGGMLWNDLDGDGAMSPDEPPLSGVTVEAVDATSTVLDSAVSGEDGSYLLAGVPAGTVTVRVDAATLPVGLDEATFDDDGVVTLHQAVWSTVGDEVRVDFDFGYRATPLGTLASVQVSSCLADPFSDPDGDGLPSSDWTLATLGDAGLGDAVVTGGALELSSNGSALWADDHGHYLHRAMPSGDFRFEARLDGFPVDPGGSRFRKAVVMARADNGLRAPRVMASVVPDYETPTGPAILFGMRQQDGDAGGPLSVETTDIGLPVRLALERRGSTYGALYSFDDGATWQRQTGGSLGGFVDLDLGASPSLGLAVASYDSLAPMTVAFDDVALCEPAAAPPWTPSSDPCDAVKPLDVIIVLDASGSMAGPFGGAIDRLDGAKAAIQQLIGHLNDRADGSRLALVVDGGVGNGPAVRVLAGLGDPGSLDALLSDLDGAALTADAPSSVAAHQQALQVLTASSDPARQPVLLWIGDGPPSFDLAGRGPYGSETQPDDLTIADGLGGFLSWPQVGWTGPHLGVIDTFAGQPWADLMATVDGGRSGVPGLRVHALTLDGDGITAPLLAHPLADFAAWLTGGSHHRGADSNALAAAMDSLWSDLECSAP